MSILLQNIYKSFDGLKVLENFSLELEDGSITCIMGESGIGKTTLARIILGLEIPDSGIVSGVPKKTAAVFQEDRLCDSFSAIVNVRIATQKSNSEILECLNALGIGKFAGKPVYKLSGGMKRRVAIARALLFDAEFIVFDEPFKGLDSDIRKTVIDYILEKAKGKTLLFITHSKEEAELLGAEIINI